MNSHKKWYVIYTRPGWESKVCKLLSKKNIETYCPQNKIKQYWAEPVKTVEEALFPSYVFVFITDSDHDIIKRTEGVYQFLHWLDKPAVIKNDEVKAIKDFLKENENVTLERIEVNTNDKVRMITAPLMMGEGNVLEVKNSSVKTLLPSLGYAIVAELGKGVVEILHHGVSQNKNYNY